MKKTSLLLLSLFALALHVNSQNCIQCDTSSNASGEYASVIGKNVTAGGMYSFAGGLNASSEGALGFSFGSNAKALGNLSFALGGMAKTEGSGSYAIGMFTHATGQHSFAVGSGFSSTEFLTNPIDNSIMFGVGSTKSTLFIKASLGLETTGKVGIGDVTEPQAKLHIKADHNESATVFIEPHVFTGGEAAKLRLGTLPYGVSAGYGRLYFDTEGNYIFNSDNANLGIGTNLPRAKLQIADGDIYIEDIDRGIIMKSPDGQCWRGTLDNNGVLNFSSTACPEVTTSSSENPLPESPVLIYPNPTGDKVFVEIEHGFENVRAEVINSTGEKVFVTGSNNTGFYIDLSKNKPGVYMVNFYGTNDQWLSTNKIIRK